MFCPKCGKENKDGAKFCAGCGNPLQVLQNAPLTEPPGTDPDPEKPSKKGKGKKKWIFIGAGAAAIIIAAAVVMILFWGKGRAGEKTQEEEYLRAIENYENVEGQLSELILSADYASEDTQTKAQLALALLEELEDDGEIAEESIEYDEDEQIICYCYADGSYGAVMLEDIAEDVAGTGTDDFVSEYDENGLIVNYNRIPEFDVSGSPYEDEYSVLIMYGFGYEDIQALLEEDEQRWSEGYLSVDLETECTVEKFRTMLAGYDYISIQLHGLLYYDKSTILLQEKADSCDMEMWLDRTLNLVGVVNMNDGTKRYFLTGEFFSFYYDDDEELDNTIVWIGSCSGFYEDSLVEGFSKGGAEAVIGCTETVNCNYGCYMQDAFMYSLLCGNTVGESLEFAKSMLGENDAVFLKNYKNVEDTDPAEFRIYTDVDWDPENITFVTLTQEAIDALSGTRITDKTSLYQAYYDKLLEYEALWGTSDRSYDEDTGYVQLEGLCFAHLIDMDGDGEEELLLGYQDSYISDYEIGLELWADVDGELTLVSSPDLASLDGGSFLFNMITELDGTYYIVNGDLGNGGGGTFYLYSYSDGKLSLSKTLVAGGEGECSIDGESVSVDEAWELADEIYNNAQYYYFYEFTYYSDPTDFAMADDELEVTLKILMDYLGIGTSSSASGSSDDWAETYLDFLEEEVTISEYTWLYYSETYSYEYFEGNPYDYVGFGLIYVNDDDIPELVMYGTSEATGMLIFTIDEDGEIDVIMSERTNSFYYAKKGNLLVNSAGVSGWSFDYIYTIEDGKWVQLARGDYEYYDADEDGTLEYYWNDEEVTEEEYEENLSSYEAGLSMTYPESDPEYDLSELKEYLNAQ